MHNHDLIYNTEANQFCHAPAAVTLSAFYLGDDVLRVLRLIYVLGCGENEQSPIIQQQQKQQQQCDLSLTNASSSTHFTPLVA